jgi:hypothetical protein
MYTTYYPGVDPKEELMPDLRIKSVPASISKDALRAAAEALGLDPSQVRELHIDLREDSRLAYADLMVLDEHEEPLVEPGNKLAEIRIRFPLNL